MSHFIVVFLIVRSCFWISVFWWVSIDEGTQNKGEHQMREDLNMPRASWGLHETISLGFHLNSSCISLFYSSSSSKSATGNALRIHEQELMTYKGLALRKEIIRMGGCHPIVPEDPCRIFSHLCVMQEMRKWMELIAASASHIKYSIPTKHQHFFIIVSLSCLNK